MKRNRLLLCTVILLVCFLSRCAKVPVSSTSEPDESQNPASSSAATPEPSTPEISELAELREEINQNGNIGAAFIGYVDSESTEEELFRYLSESETGKEYPFLSDAPLVMTEGQELYAIVPPNEAGTITVYPSGITEYGEYADDKSNPLYTGKPGEAVVVMCNLSEIYSNVLVTATDGGGAMGFRPALSMEEANWQRPQGCMISLCMKKSSDGGIGGNRHRETP